MVRFIHCHSANPQKPFREIAELLYYQIPCYTVKFKIINESTFFLPTNFEIYILHGHQIWNQHLLPLKARNNYFTTISDSIFQRFRGGDFKH